MTVVFVGKLPVAVPSSGITYTLLIVAAPGLLTVLVNVTASGLIVPSGAVPDVTVVDLLVKSSLFVVATAPG